MEKWCGVTSYRNFRLRGNQRELGTLETSSSFQLLLMQCYIEHTGITAEHIVSLERVGRVDPRQTRPFNMSTKEKLLNEKYGSETVESET